MPVLLACLPCEKTIVDAQTKNTSVIAILQEVRVTIPAGMPPPPVGSFAPTQWSVLSLWERQDGDADKTFDVRWKLVFGDEKLIESEPSSLKMDKAVHRFINVVNAFPIWRTGTCRLVLGIREQGQLEFSEMTAFPIRVTYGVAPRPV